MKTKTHIDSLRESNYLGGWDLFDENGKKLDKDVTIKEIKKEMVYNQKSNSEESVITVHFEECKPIILNSTNRKRIKKATGLDYIEEMVGKKVTLTTERIKAFGDMHDAIRIKQEPPKVLSADEIKAVIKQAQDCKDIPSLTKLYNSNPKFRTNKDIVNAIKLKNKELKV